MLTVVAEILRKTIGDYSVDQDRVYLAGVSSGGNGCWEIAMRHPDLFAAVVPMGSGGGDLSRAANLVNIPIWAFHSLEDKSTPPVGTQQMAAAVMAPAVTFASRFRQSRPTTAGPKHFASTMSWAGC